MTKYIFTLLLLTISISCKAQSIEKRYSSYLSEKGTINFFRPKKLDKKINVDKFVFDMTYVANNDSAIINCSLNIKSGGVAKELNFISDNRNIEGDAITTLYRDVLKNGYTIRVSSRFPIKVIKEVFSNNSPLIFSVTLTDGINCKATYKPSEWKKERLQITRILESINY